MDRFPQRIVGPDEGLGRRGLADQGFGGHPGHGGQFTEPAVEFPEDGVEGSDPGFGVVVEQVSEVDVVDTVGQERDLFSGQPERGRQFTGRQRGLQEGRPR